MAFVLVVDDDKEFAEAVKMALQEDGHEVAIEIDTATAQNRLGQQRPDLMVLDVMFPESVTAGFQLARNIQRDHPDIPILMLTAVNQQFPLGFSKRDADPNWLPIAEFMEKPVDLMVLRQKVTSLLA